MPGPSTRSALGPDDVRWLDDFGIEVVELAGESSEFFWFDEVHLSGKVRSFVHAFADHPAWKDTDAPA